MMILHIETSTRVCSVGISTEGRLQGLKEDKSQNYSHSSVLTVFIEELIGESGRKLKDLDAVAVSQGPGSYTGLRIGVSAAKGICYALDIPLIAVDTLQALAVHGKELLSGDEKTRQLIHPDTIFCPMIDARRMEVYFNLFDSRMQALQQTQASIIGPDTFNYLENEKTLILMGDGAGKFQDVIKRENTHFMPHILPSVAGMVPLAWQKFEKGLFENVAYFEPFYLKDFVAGAPNVRGLHQ